MNARSNSSSTQHEGVFPEDSTPLEFMDLPLNAANPVAWGINDYPEPTGRHFDIHVGLEFGIVLAGQSERFYREHSFIANAGDFWLVSLWEPHGMRVLRRNTRHLVLGFIPEYLGTSDPHAHCDWMQLFRLPPDQRPVNSTAAQRRFNVAFAQRIVDLLQGDSPHRLARIRLTVQEFLLHLMDQSAIPSSQTPAPQHVVDRSEILPVMRLVEQDPGQKITLASAARVAGMSRTNFAEQFRLQTGLTFASYLTRRRVGGVMGDLRASDDKLDVIARRWGFADASHLVRVFRQQVGSTPDAYRHSKMELQRPGASSMPRPTLFLE